MGFWRGVKETFRPREHFRLLVVGPRLSGKTTLVNYWRSLPAPEAEARTLSSRPQPEYVDFEIIHGNRSVRITIDRMFDVSGALSARDEWRRYAEGCHLVYLVDARALCGCLGWTDHYRGGDEPMGWARIRDDIDAIDAWGRTSPQAERRRCVLVVTHTDEDCRRRHTHDRPHVYRDKVARELVPLQHILRADNAPVVVAQGSLRDPAHAAQVSQEVISILRQWGTPTERTM